MKKIIPKFTKDIEGIFGVFKLLVVIDGVDLGLALGDVDVVVDVVAGSALGAEAAIADPIAWVIIAW